MTPKPLCKLLLAASAPEGGIYAYDLFRDGTLVQTAVTPLSSPMFLCPAGEGVAVIVRSFTPGTLQGGLYTASIREDGTLYGFSQGVSTEGDCACHVCEMDGRLYVANYLSGSIFSPGLPLLQGTGHGPNLPRQDGPHAHCVLPAPGGRFLLCTDLGLDRVRVCTPTLQEIGDASVPAGHGARHLCFSPEGDLLYCVNELAATVTVFRWEEPHLTPLQTVSCGVDFTAHPENLAAAIRVQGSFLYVSQRGEDSLTVFRREGSALHRVGAYPVGGNAPRDFCLTKDGSFALCCCMGSSLLTVLPLQDGIPQPAVSSAALPAPLCVVCR